MNKNKEFRDLKNTIAWKSVAKIIIYTLCTILILSILIDGVLNDFIADYIYNMNDNIYMFCTRYKIEIMIVIYVAIFSGISFVVIRKLSNYIIETTSAMDKILKEPEREVTMSKDLIVLENKLNNIRVDLITSQSVAKESEQKKNDLIMYMAHDLKTPLTSVIGYLTLLTQENEISEPLKEKYMNIALDKAIRLEELTNQFFEITRYNLQNMPINKKKIDLSFLIDQLVDECYPMLQKRKLGCAINKDSHIEFFGDGDKLARAFENLLKNAINYSYENTNIEIEMKQNDNKICISFKNKGDKIPEYKLDKIFDKFYRADESRTTSTGGTGLGLAITKEIIELHEGSIIVKNEEETIEFYIELTIV